jgi:cold shock CspA family protein/ribosome-associated translation inhibitor RaiA
MDEPLEITYRDVDKSEAIERLIRRQMGKLERVCQHIISGSVAVERPHKHQRAGSNYRVRVNLLVPPRHEIAVEHTSTEGDLHEPLPKVVRETFEAARRQLQELRQRQRGEVKTHPKQQTDAIVSRLFPEEGYGFLTTTDERTIYFHRHSVLHGDFDRLQPGTGVRLSEEQGEKGPQASTVEITSKPGPGVAHEHDVEDVL